MTITNGYCTLAELKAVLRISDTVDDAMLSERIDEASRSIDDYCDRRFYADTSLSARVFTSQSGSYIMVDDISTATGLIVKTDTGADGTYATTLSAADIQTLPLNAIAKNLPITRIQATGQGSFPTRTAIAPIQVTAKWGWPIIPQPVRSACILMAGRLVKRGDSLLGVAGFGDLGAISVRPIDPDVARMLAPYTLISLA